MSLTIGKEGALNAWLDLSSSWEWHIHCQRPLCSNPIPLLECCTSDVNYTVKLPLSSTLNFYGLCSDQLEQAPTY